MSLSMGRAARASIAFGTLAIAVATPACRRTHAEDGRARLAGHYTYADLRSGYGTVINPNFKSASLELRADGTAFQTCEFKDGKRYQSTGAKWRYDGDGLVAD